MKLFQVLLKNCGLTQQTFNIIYDHTAQLGLVGILKDLMQKKNDYSVPITRCNN